MPILNQWLEVDFGKGFQGLVGTIGYRLYDTAGADVVARTTAGVVAVSPSGSYGVEVASIADTVVGVEWDTGNVSGSIYATEDISELKKLETISGSIIAGGSEWDELLSDHEGAGTFGEHVGKKLLTFIKFIATKDA